MEAVKPFAKQGNMVTRSKNATKANDYLKNRIFVPKGKELLIIKTEDIALAYTKERAVFIVNNQNYKYTYDKNLTELEEALDPTVFFRANRQFLINIHYVKAVKTVDRVKLSVTLNEPFAKHEIIISQLQAAEFKKWIQYAGM